MVTLIFQVDGDRERHIHNDKKKREISSDTAMVATDI